MPAARWRLHHTSLTFFHRRRVVFHGFLTGTVFSNFVSLNLLSFFEVPKGVLENLDYYRSRFFWQSDEHKKKYRLAKWSILCQPKEIEGLDIKNLDTQNRCLLSKWMFKLINEEGIWQSLLRNKYLKNQTIAQVEKKNLGTLNFGLVS